jgi:hypothetical protein
MAIVADLHTPDTLTFPQALTQAEAQARTTLAPELHARLSCAVALVETAQVFQANDGTTWRVASSSKPGTHYTVNGTCSCQDAFYKAPCGLCKHRLSVYLYRRALQLMHAPPAPVVPDGPPPEMQGPQVETQPPAAAPVHGIDPRYLILIQNKPFIRFEGLLAMAHERGLVELTTTVVTVTTDFAVCMSTATFADGKSFTDIGDASPSNVKRHLAPHYIRMSATRASARALRRALNIHVVALEELGEDE